jgi:hypothetical protein
VTHPSTTRWFPRFVAWLLSMTLLLLAAPVSAAAPPGESAPAAPTPEPLQTSLLEEVDDDPCGGAPAAAYTDRDQARAEHLAGIDCATWRRIVEGSTVNDRLVYRPRVSVSRGELATFIAQTLIAAGYEHRLDDGAGTPEFRDIAGHPDERRINQLARAGIITADPNGRYQPNAAVHREQVAATLVRAYEWALEVDLTASGSHFTDVPASSVHAEDINAGYEQDLFTGTAPGRFSPRRSVAREEMATFSVSLLRAVWTDDDGLNVLAARARALIAYIEASELPCETRTPIVRRLRILHDAIESGRRSSARGLLIAWMRDARTSISTGLLTAEQGATLHARMDEVLTQIGEGTPEHPRPTPLWQLLPACGGTGDLAMATAGYYDKYTSCSNADFVVQIDGMSFSSDDVKTLVEGILEAVPKVGSILSSLVDVMWPESGAPDVSALISDALDSDTKQRVSDELAKVKVEINDFHEEVENWKHDCNGYGTNWTPPKTPPSNWEDPSTWGPKIDGNWCYKNATSTNTKWAFINTLMKGHRAVFQSNDPTDYRVMLLPLFAQYETLYLAFLREGILLEPYWEATGDVSESKRAAPRKEMANQFNPDYVKLPGEDLVGISYVDAIYEQGLKERPEANSKENWEIRNAYLRDMTLNVLDLRDLWQYMDPIAYPDGAPDIKLTRMVYSDIPTKVHDWSNFHEPANVPGPLTQLSIWTETNLLFRGGGFGVATQAIEAIQSTSPPTAGPVKVGPVTGDTSLDNQYGNSDSRFMDLTASGPIVKVETLADQKTYAYKIQVPTGVNFTYARGTSTSVGDMKNGQFPCTFHYPGYVLATATALGTYDVVGGSHSADTILFGFRRANSFAPSASLIGVGSGKCINMPSWTDGTQATIYACHGGANQIWSYNAATKQLLATGTTDLLTTGEKDLQAPGKCLTAGGTDPRSPVVIRECSGKADQQWELVPKGNGQGQIKAAQSGLVLDVYNRLTANGTPIQLYTASTGATNQLWRLPDPLEGQVHSIRTGRCFGVKDKSTANGATVHMWNCQQPGDTSVNERWTYNEATKAFTIYGGTKCLQATGTTAGSGVVIWDCTGAPNQQWTIDDADQTITGVQSGLVLDVDSGGTANGTKLQLWTKTSDLRNQKWNLAAKPGGAVYALAASKCLALPDGAPDSQAVITTCAARNPSQTWTYHPLSQQLTVYGGGSTYCLGADSNGTKAIGGACGSDPSQQWRLLRGGEIKGAVENVASGRCLTLTGTAAGTGVVLEDCFVEDADPPMDPTTETLQQWILGP